MFNKKSKYPDRVRDLEDIKSVFDKYGVNFYVVYGAALGFKRDGDFIEHDDDIDLAVIDKIDLKTRKAIGWALYDLGFLPQEIVFNVFGRMEPIEIGYNGDDNTGIIVCERKYKFTIFFFQEESCDKHSIQEYVCVPKLGAMKLIATPAEFFRKADTIKVNGKKYNTPGPLDKYLAYSYKNWKSKEDRDHSPTYLEDHPSYREEVMMNLHGKNPVVIFKSENPS